MQDARKSAMAQQSVELNADKRLSCLVNTDVQDWIPSPAPGVSRKLIERIGGEVARATTVVRFGADRSFPAHSHGGGEEFIVLDGVWSDEWALQPQYTYVRNYIGSRHSPKIGTTGCTILVKLRQMSHEHKEPEHAQWDVAPGAAGWSPCAFLDGRHVLHVFESPFERVVFERWEPGASGSMRVPANGEEIFVMEGSFSDDLGEHRTWSWSRYAEEGASRTRTAGPSGCLLYVKSGHLKSPEVGIGE